MMNGRILMAKFDPEWVPLGDDAGICPCGEEFCDRELVLLYPAVTDDDEVVREVICLTCHFWLVHDFMESISLDQ